MRWLIACERSGMIRDAMRALGIEAWSCDIMPTRRPSEYHLLRRVEEVLHWDWDGMIAHPVCKFLTNSGVRWLHEDPARWEAMEKACEFYNMLRDAKHIPLRGIENPIMHGYAAKRCIINKPQYVHPWWFGDPFQKTTGFQTFGLPPLVRIYDKLNYWPPVTQEAWLMGPSDDREEKRSETKPFMAKEIAKQWGLWAQNNKL